MKTSALLAALAVTGCALSHEATHAPLAPVPDLADAAADAPAARAPCLAPLVADDDYCVEWRSIAPPPCEVVVLGRVGAALAIECAPRSCVPDPEGPMTYLLDGAEWRSTAERAEPIAAPPLGSGPSTPFGDTLIAVELADGSRVATHGDVYALPEAWRTYEDRSWRDTVPPPSAFVRFGAALSADAALFVGQEAFVFLRTPR